MAKPLIFVFIMNVGIMWVQRSLTCKLLQILINPKNSAYISNYKIMIMISILKWQANPFLSYIIFQLIATDNICRQGSVFGCKIESHSHVL